MSLCKHGIKCTWSVLERNEDTLRDLVFFSVATDTKFGLQILSTDLTKLRSLRVSPPKTALYAAFGCYPCQFLKVSVENFYPARESSRLSQREECCSALLQKMSRKRVTTLEMTILLPIFFYSDANTDYSG